MGALAHNDVALLVLDTLQKIRQLPHLGLKGVLLRIGLRDVDNAVDIERHLLVRRAPVLVAKAVGIFAVVLGVEGEVAVRDGLFVDLVLADRVGDLGEGAVRWRPGAPLIVPG